MCLRVSLLSVDHESVAIVAKLIFLELAERKTPRHMASQLMSRSRWPLTCRFSQDFVHKFCTNLLNMGADFLLDSYDS